MNIPIKFPTDITGWLILIGLVAVAYFVVRRADVNSIQAELIQARLDNDELRKRLDDKDRENKDLQKQINLIKEDFAQLKGKNEEKDKRIDALEHVQITLPPEVMTYQQDVRNFMSQTHQWMLATTQTLTEVNQRSKTR